MTPAQRKALEEARLATEAFAASNPAQYGATGPLVNEDLGSSQFADITTDPKYKQAELAALRELEEQSKNGFTARDRADMARVQSQVGQGNRGRIGAIQQNMQARGMAGSGMELAASMQSAQDANEMAAMRAMEQEAMMMDRKSGAIRELGTVSSSLQQRDFGQAAAKAQAADEIARFNNANRNNANQFNVANTQQIANMNTGATNDHTGAVLHAKTAGATLGYNAATEEENRRLLAEQERRRRRDAKNQAGGALLGGVIGAVGGGFATGGSPQGIATGGQLGSNVGGSAGYVSSDERLKKDVAPEHDFDMDDFLNMLSAKSYSYKGDDKPRHGVLAQDLAKSKIGQDMLREDADGMGHIDVADAVSGLLAAVAHLNKKVNK